MSPVRDEETASEELQLSCPKVSQQVVGQGLNQAV